jgi:hypothetical protein
VAALPQRRRDRDPRHRFRLTATDGLRGRMRGAITCWSGESLAKPRKDGAMTDIVLRDIDSVLADRIRGIGEAQGWGMAQTLLYVLEQGLSACEGDGAVVLADHEAGVLQAAIAALERVPSDPGFALIGRAPAPAPAAPEPDQSIAARFVLESSGALK